jgi:quercetin dioxygenase-like cupin family protein
VTVVRFSELATRTVRAPLSAPQGAASWVITDTPEVLYLYWRLGGGQRSAAHSHPDCSEQLTVLDGALFAWIDGTTELLGPHDSIVVPRGAVHAMGAMGNSDLYVVEGKTPRYDTNRIDYHQSCETTVDAAFAEAVSAVPSRTPRRS